VCVPILRNAVLKCDSLREGTGLELCVWSQCIFLSRFSTFHDLSHTHTQTGASLEPILFL